jgi:hypothetical protein
MFTVYCRSIASLAHYGNTIDYAAGAIHMYYIPTVLLDLCWCACSWDLLGGCQDKQGEASLER